MMNFDEVTFQQVSRSENEKANALAKVASSAVVDLDKAIYFQQLQFLSVEHEDDLEINRTPSWMDPIKAFLENEELSDVHLEAQKLERRATKFLMHEGRLLRKLVTKTNMHTFLQCLHPEEVELALVEIHEEVCENHEGARILVHKAIRQ